MEHDDVTRSRDPERDVAYSRNAGRIIVHSDDAECNVTYSRDAERDVSRKRDVEGAITHSNDTGRDVAYLREAESDVTYSRDAESDITYSRDAESEIMHSHDTERDVTYSHDTARDVSRSGDTERGVMHSYRDEVTDFQEDMPADNLLRAQKRSKERFDMASHTSAGGGLIRPSSSSGSNGQLRAWLNSVNMAHFEADLRTVGCETVDDLCDIEMVCSSFLCLFLQLPRPDFGILHFFQCMRDCSHEVHCSRARKRSLCCF